MQLYAGDSTRRRRSSRRPTRWSRRRAAHASPHAALVLAAYGGREERDAGADRREPARRGRAGRGHVADPSPMDDGAPVQRPRRATTRRWRRPSGGASGPTSSGSRPGRCAELIEAAARTGQPRACARPPSSSSRRSHPGVAAPTGRWASRRALARCSATAPPPSTCYREAIERLAPDPHPRRALARAHLLYGEWLRRENRRLGRARAAAHRARDVRRRWARTASPNAPAASSLATGETLRVRAVEARDQLTPQEAQIARLAARRPDEPGDRRPAVHQPPHGRVAPAQGVRQARDQVPQGPPRRPAEQ